MQTHIVFGDGTFVTLAEMTPDDLVAIFALALCGVGEAIDVLEAAPDREGWDRAGALNTRRDMQAKVDAFYAELQRVLAGPLCGCTNGWFITQDEEPQIERCDECKLIATDEDAAALPAAQEALREAQNAAPTTGVEHVCPWALRDPPAGPKLATCGICNRTWCEACEPTPSALCPWCHGMGFSKAPVRVKVWELPDLAGHNADGELLPSADPDTDPETILIAFCAWGGTTLTYNHKDRLGVDFEHGGWFVTHIPSGRQWSVVDASGGDSVDGFSFERVSDGDDLADEEVGG